MACCGEAVLRVLCGAGRRCGGAADGERRRRAACKPEPGASRLPAGAVRGGSWLLPISDPCLRQQGRGSGLARWRLPPELHQFGSSACQSCSVICKQSFTAALFCKRGAGPLRQLQCPLRRFQATSSRMGTHSSFTKSDCRRQCTPTASSTAQVDLHAPDALVLADRHVDSVASNWERTGAHAPAAFGPRRRTVRAQQVSSRTPRSRRPPLKEAQVCRLPAGVQVAMSASEDERLAPRESRLRAAVGPRSV